MSTLSTHVLDTMLGKPAVGVALMLIAGEDLIHASRTNGDGRCRDFPDLTPGRYRLTFGVGDYYRALGLGLPDPPFLDTIPIDFGIGDAGLHYHVPLLVSPYGYSTYRGS